MSISIENVFQYLEDELNTYLGNEGIDPNEYPLMERKRYMTVYFLRNTGYLKEDTYTQNPKFGEYLEKSKTWEEFKNHYIPKNKILRDIGNKFINYCKKNDIDNVKQYLDKYDNKELLEYKKNQDYTVLMEVSRIGHTEIVKLLLETGLSHPEYQNKKGHNALMFASERGYTEIVELLIDSGSTPEYQDKYGNTALMGACFNGHVKIVELLLKSGLSHPEYINREGKTALDIARERDHIETVNFIENYRPFEAKFAGKRK